MNIEFIAYHCDIPSEAAKRGIGEEEAGRLVRYEKFYETAEKKNGAKTAVAHNMNDKAETLIMNLCRGAGTVSYTQQNGFPFGGGKKNTGS